MCGIAGYFQKKSQDDSVLRNMCDSIRTRGPDEEGYYTHQGTHLGHRRLSIIDLKEGQQPMVQNELGLSIVYNGEVYNYKELREELKHNFQFKTHSDTEVILAAYHQWGSNCLSKFNGMFAFCIYDQTKQTLFIARDRTGQKPLYYTKQHGLFAFSSDIKSLKHHPDLSFNLDQQRLAEYFAFEYIPNPGTLYHDVYKLEPGHFLTIQLDTLQIQNKKWWNTNFTNSNYNIGYNEAKERLYTELTSSLKYRMIADVPIGVFLSGGVDSSTCLALLKHLYPEQKIKTFSVGFEEKSFNESSYSREMAEKFDTEHYESTLKPSTLLEVFPYIRENMQDPIADGSIIPTTLLCQHASKYVKVAIGGDGADELLAGYPTFYAHEKTNSIRFPNFINNALLKCAQLLPVNMDNISFDFKIKQTLKGMSYTNPIRNQAWLGAAVAHEVNSFLPDANVSDETLFKNLFPHWTDTKDLSNDLNRINNLYIKTYMTDDILTKVDRASMMHALEVRAPFLDVNLIEFVNTLPFHYKQRKKEGKIILKEMMGPYLPHHILYRPKKGFGMPISHWFRHELKDLLHEEIQQAHSVFDKKVLMQYFDQHQKGEVDQRKKLFSFLMVNHLIH